MMRQKRLRTIGLLLLLFALLLCLCGCQSDAKLSDGMVAVRVDTHRTPIHEQEPGTHYYTILSTGFFGHAAHCEAFEPDEADVFSVSLPRQDLVGGRRQPRVGPIVIRDESGGTVDDDPVLAEIAELFRNHPHDVFDMKIYRIDGEYLLCFAENVNLHTPYLIYYYNTAQKKVYLLYQFEDEYIEAVRIVSPEKLHGLR